jgi:hypothetical protein
MGNVNVLQILEDQIANMRDVKTHNESLSTTPVSR